MRRPSNTEDGAQGLKLSYNGAAISKTVGGLALTRQDQVEEEIAMPTMYARCNNFMSGATSGVGQNCKFIAIGESEDDVYEKVIDHMGTTHADKMLTPTGELASPRELENTIRRCIFTKGTKTIHNRGPDAEANHS